MQKLNCMSFNEFDKLEECRDRFKVQCKCGTKTILTNKTDRTICRGCHNWIFRTPELEFKYRIKEKVNELRINE